MSSPLACDFGFAIGGPGALSLRLGDRGSSVRGPCGGYASAIGPIGPRGSRASGLAALRVALTPPPRAVADAVPARRLGKGAVGEHDRGGHQAVPSSGGVETRAPRLRLAPPVASGQLTSPCPSPSRSA